MQIFTINKFIQNIISKKKQGVNIHSLEQQNKTINSIPRPRPVDLSSAENAEIDGGNDRAFIGFMDPL